ncbi:uncharacterized protein LOC121379963 [Gigantopelta aegis]|uniref:uncharacterized protein LOC121379963 n=1 Tax=Gigantopelta aegis TaxID=1735272 RepID=UPI001B88C446|nr:uncharacterized protein LOC121379963 [Gigantopelta aegis]
MWMFVAWFLWIFLADYVTLSSATNTTTILPTTTTSSTYPVGVAITVSIVAICLATMCILVIALIVGYLYKRKIHILLDRLKENGGDGIQNDAYQEATPSDPTAITIST